MSVQTITTNPVFTANGTDVEKFGASLRGQLLTPDDEGYDQARAHGLTVSVRGGGHSFAGRSVCDGGLMIDLSPMKGIHVDPTRRTARAEPGVLLRELDHETQA